MLGLAKVAVYGASKAAFEVDDTSSDRCPVVSPVEYALA